jgi:hypothetical protein
MISFEQTLPTFSTHFLLLPTGMRYYPSQQFALASDSRFPHYFPPFLSRILESLLRCRLLSRIGPPVQQCVPKVSPLVVPPELILMIASQLDDVSRISFALTCRSVYSLCFPTSPVALRKSDTEELLLRLQRDDRRMFCCLLASNCICDGFRPPLPP